LPSPAPVSFIRSTAFNRLNTINYVLSDLHVVDCAIVFFAGATHVVTTCDVGTR